MICEPSWNPLWRHFPDLFVIWGDKVRDSVQTHVFDDPGLEILPGSGGCMCYNHCENNGFLVVSLFLFIS